jgi:glycosyltransferase involved in cell wall biosynthesis
MSARYATRLMESLTLPRADAIVTVTKGLKREISNRFQIDGGRIVVVSNGVDTDLYVPKNKLECRKLCSIAPGRKVVCYVGNFTSWQGLHTLVESAPMVLKTFPDTLFLLVGDGPLRESLTSRIESLGIASSFSLVGKVPNTEVPDYINASDVCVAPFIRARSETIGLSPLKLYAYMSCAKAIVASDVPGVGDLLKEHDCGAVVKPDDPTSLAEGIKRLLRDDDLRYAIGNRARRVVVKSYSWERVSAQIGQLCVRTILAGR